MKNAGVKILVGAGVVVGGIYLVKGLRTQDAADKLVIKFEGIHNFRITGGKVKFDLNYSALNPTSKDLNIESMFLDLGLRDSKQNDLQIGKVESTSVIAIPGKQKVYRSLAIETNGLFFMGINLILALLNWLATGNPLPDSAYIKGTVIANGFTKAYNEMIPFKTSATEKPAAVKGMFGLGRLGDSQLTPILKSKRSAA